MDALKSTELENDRLKDEIIAKDIAIMRLREKLRELRPKPKQNNHKPRNHNRFFPNGNK